MPLDFSPACYRSKEESVPILSPYTLNPVSYPSHRRIVAILRVLEVYSSLSLSFMKRQRSLVIWSRVLEGRLFAKYSLLPLDQAGLVFIGH